MLFICRRSGAVKAVALKSKEAIETARAFEYNILYSTGPPSILTHDQGFEMKGHFAQLESENGIKIIKSSAYHPEGNGKAEAGIKKLKRKLLRFLENETTMDDDWDQIPLIKAVHSINTTVSTLHGLTPFEVVLGRPVNEKSILTAEKKSTVCHTPIRDNLEALNLQDKILREKTSKTVHAVIRRGQKRQIKSYNKKWLQKEPIKEGDRVVIRDHRHGKEGKKHQTSILPVSRDLFYIVTWISDDGLTCVVERSNGGDKKRLHVNDTMLIHKGLPQKRKRRKHKHNTQNEPCGKIPADVKAYCKYATLTDNEKVQLEKLTLTDNYKTRLFDRRRYLDDSVALVCLKLLEWKYPHVNWLSSVLLAQRPQDRVKNNPPAAEVLHCYPSNHFVMASLIASDIVVYMDSGNPGSKPKKAVIAQIEASFNLKRKYVIRSIICQKQSMSDCLPFAVANLDICLSGEDNSKVRFNKKFLRAYLVKSLVNNNLVFPHKRCKIRGKPSVYVRQVMS